VDGAEAEDAARRAGAAHGVAGVVSGGGGAAEVCDAWGGSLLAKRRAAMAREHEERAQVASMRPSFCLCSISVCILVCMCPHAAVYAQRAAARAARAWECSHDSASGAQHTGLAATAGAQQRQHKSLLAGTQCTAPLNLFLSLLALLVQKYTD
jgi:hypothetical protein